MKIGKGFVSMSTIGFFSYEKYHGKSNIGSTKIRVHNLIKYWPEASLYKYGQKPDVLIFQKVYVTFDYKFPTHYTAGKKILDICDPDWVLTPDNFVKETMDAMDAVVVPTQALKEFLSQMTNTPVVVIKDRFDLTEFPRRKKHVGKAKTIVWFGYAQNAQLLKFAVPSLERRDLNLIIISNEDPFAYKWALNREEYEPNYTYIKFNDKTIYKDIQRGDICIMPYGDRPQDVFKSENKTIQSLLCGVPVARDAKELDDLMDAEARNKAIEEAYQSTKEAYDCKKSVVEYKRLIERL